MKKILVVAAPLVLGACGGPIELTVAKLAGDLISYVSTGKSTTDHAVSFVAEQDCALHRPLLDQDICKDEETVLAEEAAALAVLGEPEIKQEIRAARPGVYAVNAPAEDWSQPSKSVAKSNAIVTTDLPPLPPRQNVAATRVSESSTLPSPHPIEMASAREQLSLEGVSVSAGDLEPIDPQIEADAAVAGYVNDAPLVEDHPPGETVTAALSDMTTIADDIGPGVAPIAVKDNGKTPDDDDLAMPLPGDYVVLASFADKARAQKALGIYQEYQPRLLNAEVKGTPYLRVAVGPLTSELAHDLRLLAAKKGVKDPWIVGVDPTGE